MDAPAPDFARASLRTSTYRQYSRLWERFTDLALARGFSCLPVSTEHFEILLADFAAATASTSSTQKLLAAVTFFHRYHGFQPPATAARGRLILRGIARTYARPVKRAAPITPDIVKAAIYYQIGSDLDKRFGFAVSLITWRTVAQLVISFAGLARFHCLTNISMKDVVFINGGVQLTFWNTKTDTLNAGQTIFLSPVASYACPVRFIASYFARLQWEAFLGGFFPYVGPLLPSLTARGGSSSGVTSLSPTARPFSKQAATISLRAHLTHLGVPNAASYTLHSGRRGGATHAALNGCDFISIKRQGRWASDSCPQLYIDEAATLRSTFSRFLGLET